MRCQASPSKAVLKFKPDSPLSDINAMTMQQKVRRIPYGEGSRTAGFLASGIWPTGHAFPLALNQQWQTDIQLSGDFRSPSQ